MGPGQSVALTGMVVSGSLAALKIVVGLMAQSTSVVADGVESGTDVLASGVVWLGLWLASKPADENHPYGHGRVETLTGLLVGMGLILIGITIAYHSLRGIESRTQVPAAYAVWPLLVSIVAKSLLASYKYYHGRRLSSAALLADAWNDAVDTISAAVAFSAVTLARYDPDRYLHADSWGGFAVGIIVVLMGLHVARDAALQLMDTMPGEDLLRKVRDAAMTVGGVTGVEKCYARKTGFQYHVDLHVEVSPELTVRASHDIATQVRACIKESLPWVADVLVHIEPSP